MPLQLPRVWRCSHFPAIREEKHDAKCLPTSDVPQSYLDSCLYFQVCVCSLIDGCFPHSKLINASTLGSETEIVVSGLKPSHLYMVKYAAFNEKGKVINVGDMVRKQGVGEAWPFYQITNVANHNDNSDWQELQLLARSLLPDWSEVKSEASLQMSGIRVRQPTICH